jgi:colicin import membrane protein
MNEVLPPETSTPIVEYTHTARALGELRQKYQGIVYDVTVAAEMTAARAARRELVTLRTSLEKLRLELNATDQERIRLRNAEAKRITGEIAALEEPIDAAIKNEEERRENERKAREERERQRVSDIHAKIAGINAIPAALINKRAADIEAVIEELRVRAIDAGEFQGTAEDARSRVLATLTEMLANTRALEAARARQKEEDDRQHAERAKIIQEAAESRARIAAEQEAARAQRERDAEAERERLAQELAAERAARLALEERERAARKVREEEEQSREAEREQERVHLRALQAEKDALADARNLLASFKTRFGDRAEFRGVIAAIDKYFAKVAA